jgi:hypothetical protein
MTISFMAKRHARVALLLNDRRKGNREADE